MKLVAMSDFPGLGSTPMKQTSGSLMRDDLMWRSRSTEEMVNAPPDSEATMFAISSL